MQFADCDARVVVKETRRPGRTVKSVSRFLASHARNRVSGPDPQTPVDTRSPAGQLDTQLLYSRLAGAFSPFLCGSLD